MRTRLFIGGALAALFALPAAGDGYVYTAPSTSHGYATSHTSGASPCAVTSCCCGHQVVRTYTTTPVVRRYVQTYTRVAPPSCTATSHIGHDHAHHTYSHTGARTYSTTRTVTGYSQGGSYSGSAYSSSDGYAYGDAYYDDGYYEGDAYYEAYPAPSAGYAAELSLDREDPWNGYRR